MINRNGSIPELHNFPFPANWPEKENKRIFEISCLKMGSSILGKDEYDGKEWYKIGNYEYRVDEILRLMLIRKYKKANGHDNT